MPCVLNNAHHPRGLKESEWTEHISKPLSTDKVNNNQLPCTHKLFLSPPWRFQTAVSRCVAPRCPEENGMATYGCSNHCKNFGTVLTSTWSIPGRNQVSVTSYGCLISGISWRPVTRGSLKFGGVLPLGTCWNCRGPWSHMMIWCCVSVG